MIELALPCCEQLQGMGNEYLRFGIAPFLVTGREMNANIAVAERAQNGIDQGMQRHIAIRMAGHTALKRHADSA